MSTQPEQFTLRFEGIKNFGLQDFIVTPCNKAAWAWVQAWPQGWLTYGGCITGPAASGKTHLLMVWKQRTDAANLHDAMQANEQPLIRVRERKHWVLDDCERWLGNVNAEEKLFHWLNAIKAVGGTLLLSCTRAPSELSIILPDVRSRLLQLPALPISTPDDALVAAVLRKQLKDRQLLVGEEVIAYVLPRIERSFAGVRTLVTALDSASLARGKAITLPLAREIVGMEKPAETPAQEAA